MSAPDATADESVRWPDRLPPALARLLIEGFDTSADPQSLPEIEIAAEAS